MSPDCPACTTCRSCTRDFCRDDEPGSGDTSSICPDCYIDLENDR